MGLRHSANDSKRQQTINVLVTCYLWCTSITFLEIVICVYMQIVLVLVICARLGLLCIFSGLLTLYHVNIIADGSVITIYPANFPWHQFLLYE